MKSVQKAVRHKRYKVADGKQVMLTVEFNTGVQVKLTVDNCSLAGISGFTSDLIDTEPFTLGDIAPAAKIVWSENNEVTLGRLAIRRAEKLSDKTVFAFSTVDGKVPLDGPLSRMLEIDFSSKNGAGYELELSNDKFSLAHFVESDFSNVDLFDKLYKFQAFYKDWKKSDKYGYHTVREASKGPRINLQRKRKNNRNDYIIMGSNDYLGLSSHPEVTEAAKKALDAYGFGSTGSPVTTGITDLHEELCEVLAKMFKREKAILYNSGYVANIGIISALTGERDLICADMLSHASIHDAMQMSKGSSRYFKHNDQNHLNKILTKEREEHNGALVISEGVFSMDGDVPPLDKIMKTARDHNCRVMIDEAHSFGVIGEQGLGACEKFGILKDVDVIMGTFSKISGTIGGFAVGSVELIDWLKHFSRAHIFSVSLAPSTVAATLKSLELFREDKSLLKTLKSNIQHFVKGLQGLGYSIADSHETAVIPVTIGDEKKLGQIYQSLLDDGIFVVPIVYPAVSRKNCRFRFTIMASHNTSDLDYVLSCLEKAMIKADFKFNDNQSKLLTEDAA